MNTLACQFRYLTKIALLDRHVNLLKVLLVHLYSFLEILPLACDWYALSIIIISFNENFCNLVSNITRSENLIEINIGILPWMWKISCWRPSHTTSYLRCWHLPILMKHLISWMSISNLRMTTRVILVILLAWPTAIATTPGFVPQPIFPNFYFFGTVLWCSDFDAILSGNWVRSISYKVEKLKPVSNIQAWFVYP